MDLRIVARHVAQAPAERELLRLAGGELARLRESSEHDRAHLRPRGGPGGAVVELYHVLARHAAGVGYGDGRLDGAVLAESHAVERLLESRVGEAEAEGEGHVRAVIDGTLRISGLEPAVAHVDALGVLDEVDVAAELGVVVGDVGVAPRGEVGKARRRREIGSPGIGGAAGRVHDAREHVAHGKRPHAARESDLHDRVGLIGAALLHERAHLHGGRHVEQHDELRAGCLRARDERELLARELELVLALDVALRLAVGCERLHLGVGEVAEQVYAQVVSLCAGTSQHHDADRSLNAGPHILGIVLPRDLADVVRDGRRTVELSHGAARVAVEDRGDPLGGCRVHVEPRLRDAVGEADARLRGDAGGSRAAEDGAGRRPSEQRDACACGERERRIVVFEQHDSLGLDAPRDLLGRGTRLCAGCVCRHVVLRVPTARIDGRDG